MELLGKAGSADAMVMTVLLATTFIIAPVMTAAACTSESTVRATCLAMWFVR